jgi:hypothetical protein
MAPIRLSSGLREAACSCVNSNRHKANRGNKRVQRILNELYIADCVGRIDISAAIDVGFEGMDTLKGKIKVKGGGQKCPPHTNG